MGNICSLPLLLRLRDRFFSVKTSRRQPSKRSIVPQHEFLTDDEKELIIRTWRQLAVDPVGAGIDVFMRIFELAPEARQAFPSFNGFSNAELMDDVMFRSHATRFMRAVDSIMCNLDALDIIVIQNLVQLGRYHAAVVTEFRVEYLVVFEAAMCDVWAKRLGRRRFDEATRRAWAKIFRLITASVSDGYSEYKLQSLQKMSPGAGEFNRAVDVNEELDQSPTLADSCPPH